LQRALKAFGFSLEACKASALLAKLEIPNSGQMHHAQAREDVALQLCGQILIEAHDCLDQHPRGR